MSIDGDSLLDPVRNRVMAKERLYQYGYSVYGTTRPSNHENRIDQKVERDTLSN
jgi:hypothetical protein